MRQGIKNIVIVLLIVIACFAVALSINAQEINIKDNFEKRVGFVESNIYIGRNIIAATSVEMIISNKNDTTYYFLLNRFDECAAFSMSDITDLLDAISVLDNREKSGEYIGKNLFVLGKNEYNDRRDWYMVINSGTSRRFYFISSIEVFKYNIQQAALVLLDYKYGYKK